MGVRGKIWKAIPLCILIAEVFITNSLFAWTPPVVVNEEFKQLDLGHFVEYYVDKTNSLEVKDIEKIPDDQWQKPDKGRAIFWESDYVFWFRFAVDNQLAKTQSLVLLVDYAPIDHIFFYKKTREGKYQVQIRGDHHVDRNNIGNTWHPVFDFNSEADQKKNYYFRAESGGNSLWFPIKLFTHETHEAYSTLSTLYFGIVMGIMLALIIYNIFLFFVIKDKSYLFYIVPHIFVATYLAINIGYINFLNYPQHFTDMYFLSIFCWGALFYAPFSVILFNLKQNARFFYWVNMLIFYTGTIALILNFITGNQLIFNVILNQLIMIMHPALLLMTIYLIFRGNKIAYFFAPAMIIINIGFMTRMAVFAMVDFSFFNLYSYYGAQAFEATLSSLALGYRYNLLKKEKEIAQTEAIQNLKKSDEVKNRFLANTSHELRTPLHGIMGLVDNLKEKENDPRSREILNLVFVSAKRLNTLVNDILDFAAISKNEVSLEKSFFDPVPVIHEAIAVNSALIKKHGHGSLMNIRFDLDENMPTQKIWGDEKRFLQILNNLLGNAVKYSAASEITVCIKPGNFFSEFQIADNGKGIDQERLSRIFEPFQTEAKDASKGSGLGLSITRELVEAHGGKISAKSDTGTTFIFTMPLSPESGRTYQGESIDFKQNNVHSRKGRKILPVMDNRNLIPDIEYQTVLVVDDEQLNLRLYELQLGNHGYHILTADSAAAAWDILENPDKNKVDMILLDIMMPGISGMDFLQSLRKKYTLNELPVILVSALAETRHLAEGLSAGANDYLVKPYRPQDLRHRISHILETTGELRRAQDQKLKTEELLKKQKDEIFADIHDHLGSQLTDIKMIYENLMRKKTIDPGFAAELRENIDKSLQTLRGRISSLEDIASLSEDFLGNLQTIFLRRYVNGSRVLKFDFDESLNEELMKHPEALLRETLYTVMKEMVTNDLKYGKGAAIWNFSRNSGGVEIRLATTTIFSVAVHGTGNGTFNIQRRLDEIGGRISYSVNENEFQVLILVPLSLTKNT
jgi:signal transduction histidine kinase